MREYFKFSLIQHQLLWALRIWIYSDVRDLAKDSNGLKEQFDSLMDDINSRSKQVRKDFKHDKSVKNVNAFMKDSDTTISIYGKIQKALWHRSYLDSDFEYAVLIDYIISHIGLFKAWFSFFSKKLHVESLTLNQLDFYKATPYVLARFIEQSKKHGYTSSFTECFDEYGHVYLDKVFILRSELQRMHSALKESRFHRDLASFDDFRKVLLTDEHIEEARTYIEMCALKEQEEKKRIRKEKINALRKRQEEIALINSSKYEPVKMTYTKEELDLFQNYIDSTSYELKPSVVDIISLEDLLTKLKSLPRMNKRTLNQYKDSYLELVLQKRLNEVGSILEEDSYKELQFVLNHMDMNEDTFKSIKKYLMSDTYLEDSMEDILSKMNDFLETTYEENPVKENLLVFGESQFMENQLNQEEYQKEYEFIKKGILQHLNLLETQSRHALKKNVWNAFHEIQNNHEPFIIGDSLKGYRFGGKRTKVCFFTLSVCEENKERLSTYYGMNLSHVYLVFGLGNVAFEEEDAFYERSKRDALTNASKYLELERLVSTPFTEETFKLFTSLVDASSLEITNLKKKEYTRVLEKEN